MSVENITANMSTTTMFTQQTPLPGHVMWIPYGALVILFLLGLAFSFLRHHNRQIKKRQYIVEYQEKNLSVRRPRIQGKLGHFGDAATSIEETLHAASPDRMSNYQDDRNCGPLTTDDVHCSIVSDDRGGFGVKKRYRSTTELDECIRPYHRLISEDDYFKRKGPRDAYYIKSASERNLSPRKHRQRIYDSDAAFRTFWMKSDVSRRGMEESKPVEEAVKYIKVFDLDLCQNCRMYVETVDGGFRKVQSHSTTERCDNLSEQNVQSASSHSIIHDSKSVHKHDYESDNQDDASHHYTSQSSPQVSMAQVHAPPPPLFDYQFQPVTSGKDNERNEIQLSPLNVDRPRSAPDLSSKQNTNSDYFKLGLQESGFKLRPQFSFNPRRQAPTPQRRPRGRERPGVFWLDIDTHQHTLV